MADPVKIGVIGGGQLAWMMGPAAQKLGLELCVQTPSEEDPAVAIATDTILAPVADAEGTARLSQHCDLITFENEFIDLPKLKALEDQVTFHPCLSVLELVLDKYDQRCFYERIGLPNPPFVTLESQQELPQLAAKAADIGFPLVLKTRRLGYDGYGTFILENLEQLRRTWEQTGYAPIILEAFIPFTKELAVMVARSASGEVALYPTVETQQINQVCQRVIAPAAVEASVHEQVRHIAHTLVSALELVGIVGIELFLTEDNRVLINEIAPRTHNSGHYTLDACATSQFEQQLRAVSGLPLGPTHMTCDRAVMVNLLGFEDSSHDYHFQRSQIAQLPNTHAYWYGKSRSRPGRKLGHANICLSATENPAVAIATIEKLWYPRLDPIPLSRLNQMSQEEFTEALGAVFEDNPDIATAAWQHRPFESIDALHHCLVDIVQQQSLPQQLELIRAHPDLGNRAQMAPASVQEQAGVGLDRLTPAEYERLQQLNQAYRQTFDMPFILAVTGHTKASILEACEARLHNSPQQERQIALNEIFKIAAVRLHSWICMT